VKTRPQKIRDIYKELKSSLGEAFTSHEILRLAATIVKNAEQPKIDHSHREHVGRKLFYQADLTEAMKDGGWNILREECGALINAYDDDCDRHLVLTSQEFIVSHSYAELVG